MTMDEVLSDRDSEDEIDDDIADFEDRRVCSITLLLTLRHLDELLGLMFF